MQAAPRRANAAFPPEAGAEGDPQRPAGGRPRNNYPGSPGWTVTRSHVALVLRVDVSTVRRLEAKGDLHPQVGPGGIRSFNLREVAALKARRLATIRDRTTEVRVAAFELFRQGVDWRDVAIKLRHDPFRVYRLWRLFAVDRRAGDAKPDDS